MIRFGNIKVYVESLTDKMFLQSMLKNYKNINISKHLYQIKQNTCLSKTNIKYDNLNIRSNIDFINPKIGGWKSVLNNVKDNSVNVDYNNLTLGLIDRDDDIYNKRLKKISKIKNRIFILNRRTIENFIFDPILLFSILSESEIILLFSQININSSFKFLKDELILLCSDIHFLLNNIHNNYLLQNYLDNYFKLFNKIYSIKFNHTNELYSHNFCNILYFNSFNYLNLCYPDYFLFSYGYKHDFDKFFKPKRNNNLSLIINSNYIINKLDVLSNNKNNFYMSSDLEFIFKNILNFKE